MNETQRQQLRTQIDEAKRTEMDAEGRTRRALIARSPDEIKRQTAASKGIVAAAGSAEATADQPLVLAEAGNDTYLLSVGAGYAHVLDLRTSPRVSKRSDVYAFLAGADWMPFTGDPTALLAVTRPLLEAQSTP